MNASSSLEVKYPEFANRLTASMEQKAINMKQLSERSEISYEMIRRYTAGYAMPRQKGMKSIANILGVTASWLQFGECKVENNNNNINQSHITGNVSQINHNHQACNHVPQDFVEYGECRNPNLETFFSKDNSMSPTIPQGSKLWADTNETEIKDGKIYLVEYGGLQTIRRLFAEVDGQVRLKAYHCDYPERILSANEIHIIGRVIQWCVRD